MSNKAVFLDRDNTLIEDPGYINHPDQVRLLDGITDAIIELKDLGYKLIVVSNQSAVARGIVTEKVLNEIHDRLKQLLAEKGAFLDQIYYCPYHPDGVVRKYCKESNMRKPNPGMLLTAAEEMDIDLSRSWMIGDSVGDIEAGLRAGCRTIFIKHSWDCKSVYDGPDAPKPHYSAVNLREATNIIKRYHRSDITESAIDSVSVTESEIVVKVSQAEEATDSQIQSEPAVQTATMSQPEEQSCPSESTNAKESFALPLIDTGAPKTDSPEPKIDSGRSEQLLSGILEQLKSMQRTNMFDEFSMMRLMAGIVQIIVLFCLLLSVWFLMSPVGQGNAVLISLGFAMVLQLMSLTFYIMQNRR